MSLVDPNRRAILLAALVSLAALGIMSPTLGQAADLQDPLVVTETDFDASFPFASWDGPDELSYVDENNDGRFGGQEPVYLTNGNGQVESWDVRIAHPPVGELGSQVHPGDPDRNGTVAPLRGSIRYFDQDNNGAFGPHDTLIFDTNDGQRTDLDANDLILSGSSAGARAGASHPFIGSELVSWSGQIRWSDIDPDGAYGQGDRVFLDSGRDDRLSVRDIRITDRAFGTIVTVGDLDAVYALETSSAPDELIFVDGDGDGRFDRDEPAYLSTSRDKVVGGSVRIANPGDHEPGSRVRGGHSDFGKAATRLDADLAFLDTDGTGSLTAHDVIYADHDDDQEDAISVRDIVLTGQEAGTVVSGEHDAFGARLIDFDGRIAYVDLDGSEAYSGGDPIFFDANGDGVLGPSDLPPGPPEPSLPGPAYRPGLLRTLTPLPAAGAFAFTDQDGDHAYDAGEPLYFALQGTSRTTQLDLRIASPPSSHAIGSQVARGDEDHGTPLVELDARMAYRDLDRDQRISSGDPVYLDADRTGTLTLGDVVLTTLRGGLPVLDDDPGLGRPLTLYPGLPSYFDADGSGSYNAGDLFYFDTNGDGLVTPLDIGYRSPLPDTPLDELLVEPGSGDGDGDGESEDDEQSHDNDQDADPAPEPSEDEETPPDPTPEDPEESADDESSGDPNGSGPSSDPEDQGDAAKERRIPIRAMTLVLALSVAARWSRRA